MMKSSIIMAWAEIKAPMPPMPEPNAKPHFRPQARIKKAAGKVPNEVPISIIVIGTVANVRFSPNMAIETRDAVKNVRVRPLIIDVIIRLVHLKLLRDPMSLLKHS